MTQLMENEQVAPTPAIKKEKPDYRCLNCGYEWQPKRNKPPYKRPKACPNCNNRNWDKRGY